MEIPATDFPEKTGLSGTLNVHLACSRRGRVLELGGWHGRNALYPAGLGCRVDAVDFSARRSPGPGSGRNRRPCRWISGAAPSSTRRSYDLVDDPGCFHHLPPHRRRDYVQLVSRALEPGGCFGRVCFRPEGGSGYTDQQVYERAGLGGGLGYTEDRLRLLWDKAPFSVRVLRQMTKATASGPCFGEDFLWALPTVKDGPG